MFRLCPKALLVAALGVALGGCELPVPINPTSPVPVPSGTMSVFSLAGRLGMRVDQSSRSMAALTGTANRVLVLGLPDSRVYVNGRPLGEAGKIQVVNDTLFVPVSMEPQIRAALRDSHVATDLTHSNEIRRPPPPQPPSGTPGGPIHGLVVIDPGHGGKDPGAMAKGLQEKDLNLSVAQMVTEDLKARGAKVIMTRADNTFVELDERADVANRYGADLFVAIHTNASTKPGICGFAVYVSETASQSSVAAADAIAHRLEQGGIAACGPQPHRAGYRVLVHNHRPAVLLEMGFITNTADAGNLASPRYQRMLADNVAEGIADFLRGK